MADEKIPESEDNLPDGAAPPEEELNINGPDEPKMPVDGGPQLLDEDQVNKMDERVGDLGLQDEELTSREVLNRVLQASEEQLIPWEECHLPSRGMYYGWSDGIIMVKAMGQTAEKVLATQRLAQSGQSIDYLFKECCQFPDEFDATDLLLGDRVFLLYFLRGITYGNLYEFAVTCPNVTCNATNTHIYDLNELAQTIVWANNSLGSEPFKVILPYFSKVTKKEFWVGVRFLRAKDANEMLGKRKFKKKSYARPGNVKTNPLKYGRGAGGGGAAQQQELDDTITDNLEKIIVNVMGESDLFTIRNFIGKLHGRDTTAIREWLRENTPGIDNTVAVTCPDCETDFKVELPITENFFRPTEQ